MRFLILALLGYILYSHTLAHGAERALIEEIQKNYPFLSHVPPSLILAIGRVESGLDPEARGSRGEIGIMQVKPGTVTWVFNRYSLPEPVDPADPVANFLAGMLYLATAYEILGGWGPAIHAYNVGIDGYLLGRRNWTYFTKVMIGWLAPI